jgi:electron transport complex protein RnfG
LDSTHANPAAERVGRFRNNNLVQAWLILLLAVCFGAALAAVQVQLSDTIAANKLNETLEQVPALIWGDTQAGQIQASSLQITLGSVAVQKKGRASSYSLYRVAQSGRVAGWVIKAVGQGYADKLELLIGVDADLKNITGLFVLEQKETPGLGNKIVLPQWRNQFAGRSTDTPLQVIKGQGRGPSTIDAITGATISSRSVTAIVNTTIDNLKGRLDSTGELF